MALSYFAGLAVTVSANAGSLETPDFRDVVRGVDSAGIVYFERNGSHRLWGLLPDAENLREILVGKKLACNFVGEFEGKWRGVSAASSAVVCEIREISPNPQFPDGLVVHLLQSGHANELCSETLGLFGTCPKIGLE